MTGVLPALRKRNLHATFFITTGQFGNAAGGTASLRVADGGTSQLNAASVQMIADAFGGTTKAQSKLVGRSKARDALGGLHRLINDDESELI